jgi:hypothetical protein
MHSRKHPIGRNILRVFEIALFFAISVLGYGLLVKTSSLNSKSKSREHATGIQNTLDLSGLHRELKVLSGTFRLPTGTGLTTCDKLVRTISPDHPAFYGTIHHPDYRYSLHDSRPLGNNPAITPLPYNLLQQNPVLLV